MTFYGKAIHNLVIESNPLLDTLEPLAFKGIQELSYLSLKHNKLKVSTPVTKCMTKILILLLHR